MRRLILMVVALMVATLPAMATTCATGSIEWTGGSPLLHDGVVVDRVDTAINGTFLWVSIDEGTIVSVELDPTVVEFSACDDGTVTLVEAPPASHDGGDEPTTSPGTPNPGGASTVVDLDPVYLWPRLGGVQEF